MKNSFLRINNVLKNLSLFIIFIFALSNITFASDGDEKIIKEYIVKIDNLTINDSIVLGKYPYNDKYKDFTQGLEWEVVYKDNEKVVLFCKNIIDYLEFNNDSCTSYDNSSLELEMNWNLKRKAFSKEELKYLRAANYDINILSISELAYIYGIDDLNNTTVGEYPILIANETEFAKYQREKIKKETEGETYISYKKYSIIQGYWTKTYTYVFDKWKFDKRNKNSFYIIGKNGGRSRQRSFDAYCGIRPIIVLNYQSDKIKSIINKGKNLVDEQEPMPKEYDSIIEFENDLNNGKDLRNAIIKIHVGNIDKSILVDYNIFAGEHLNFVSEQKPTVSIGDDIVVKVTKVKNMLGSWIIEYERN